MESRLKADYIDETEGTSRQQKKQLKKTLHCQILHWKLLINFCKMTLRHRRKTHHMR